MTRFLIRSLLTTTILFLSLQSFADFQKGLPLNEQVNCDANLAASELAAGNPFFVKFMNMATMASHRQCDSDDDCPGFANYCFAGKCNQPGELCDSDDDCPGFANYCFAGKCNKQEPLCDSDDDCPGFANSCFAGKCTNP